MDKKRFAVRRFLGKVYRGLKCYRLFNMWHMRLTQLLCMRGISNPLWRMGLCDPEYWTSRTKGSNHAPSVYSKADKATEIMFQDLLPVLQPEAAVLDVGCNSGGNLAYLMKKGFFALEGIEINAEAIRELEGTWPKLYAMGKFKIGNALDEIRPLETNSYDLVFSRAVLIHIPPSDIDLFRHMVRVSRKYIAIMTQEDTLGGWPYDFHRIFCRLGCYRLSYRVMYDDNAPLLPAQPYRKRDHDFSRSFISVYIKSDDKWD